jgi:TM2 domain-containing membrane protein YozV
MTEDGAMESESISPKSRLAAALLCFFLGVFGAHRFYLRKTGTAVLMLLTLGGLGIWALVDLIFIVVGSFRDKEGKRVYEWLEPPPT